MSEPPPSTLDEDVTGRAVGSVWARVGRWVLGGLLLSMAVGQLARPVAFVDIVASYRLGGRGMAGLAAAALIVGELTAGAGLLMRNRARRRVASSVAVGVAVAWTAFGLQAFARGVVLDNCGCFGVYAGQPLRWWVLIEDAEFVVGAIWVRRGVHREVVASVTGVRAGSAVERGRTGLEA